MKTLYFPHQTGWLAGWLTELISFLARARLQALVMVLKVASRDMKEVKICFSPSQQTATALGIILAVFSFVIAVTELISSLIWR